MEKVKLTTKKELEIYMNPVRQQLIRELDIAKYPMTPKMLADKLNISASGVQHHIKKLLSLRLIELDHTELINGITASFYKSAYVTVQIGLDLEDDAVNQREALMQDKIFQVFNGFITKKKQLINDSGNTQRNLEPDILRQWGDIMTGVLHLTAQEAKELMKLITDYIESHAEPSKERFPWEYALILYNVKEEIDD